MFIVLLIICAAAAYLIGSLNSAIVVVRLLRHEDIRNFGSKNAGLTNVLRCFGKGPALVTLIADLLKGSLTIILIRAVVSAFGYELDSMTVGYVAGLMIMLGHIFPVYYGFKGGKGVLVSAAVLSAVDIRTFAIVIPVFILTLIITKYVSASSITAAAAYPVVTFIMQRYAEHIEMKTVLVHTGLVLVTAALIIYMHRTNIQRLISGTENKFSFSKK